MHTSTCTCITCSCCQLHVHCKFVLLYYCTALKHSTHCFAVSCTFMYCCYYSQILKDALTALHAAGHGNPSYQPVHTFVLNPKVSYIHPSNRNIKLTPLSPSLPLSPFSLHPLSPLPSLPLSLPSPLSLSPWVNYMVKSTS